MVALQDTSPLGEPSIAVAYNLHGTRMASATAHNGVTVHQRSSSDPTWRLAAALDALARPSLREEEHFVALDWAHPQYGELLALGTSHGRVLLLSQRPVPEGATEARGGDSMDTDGSRPADGWQLDHALLGAGELTVAAAVRSLKFCPCGMDLTLAVAHGDGAVRLLGCSTAHPLLPHAAWSCDHELRLPGNSATADSAAPCVSLSWQPQPDAAAPCFVAASTSQASLWCYARHVMDWTCVCADVEAAAGGARATGDLACVAWAPLIGKTAELIAVARGSVVKIMAVDGDLAKPAVEQVGGDLKHDAPVWKVDWSAFALELAASCEAAPPQPPTVSLWRMNFESVFGPEPAVVITGAPEQ